MPVAKKATAAKKATTPRGTVRYAGRTWKAKNPNPVLFSQLAESEDLAALGYLAEACVIKEQRADFRAAMIEDEDLDWVTIDKLIGDLMTVAAKGLPTQP